MENIFYSERCWGGEQVVPVTVPWVHPVHAPRRGDEDAHQQGQSRLQ